LDIAGKGAEMMESSLLDLQAAHQYLLYGGQRAKSHFGNLLLSLAAS
jgi:hypothetical protein